MNKIYLILLGIFLMPFFLQAQSLTNYQKEEIIFSKIQQSLEHFESHAHEHAHQLPHFMHLDHVEIEDQKVVFFLDMPLDYLNEEYDEHVFEEISLHLFNSIPEGFNLTQFELLVKDEQQTYVPINNFSNEPPRTYPAEEIAVDPGLPIRASDNKALMKKINESKFRNPYLAQGQISGSLSGKTVWLSPGHGWLYYTSLTNYSTQRGNTNDMVEDFGSIEGINYYLIKYLTNAGANVWMVRERDVNENEVIVDNTEAGYSETGSWSSTTSTGYNPTNGLLDQANGYRYASTVNGAADATATWSATIPEKGWYWVSVLFRSNANRTVDARYRVDHAGGSTWVSKNQEVHGNTWGYLGQFYFEPGGPASVTLTNETSDPTASQVIIADAVRFGGGINGAAGAARDIVDCTTTSAGPTNKPRFEESARMYAPYQYYPTCRGDVTMRPHYAEYELAKGTATEQANAIYLAWHTNASANGTARGTVTYAYDGSNGSFPVTAGSYDLQGFIHNELINDIKGGWDATWNDRGVKYANFGEVRELSTMPGTLMEVAFHDNPDDALALTTPFFRDLAARAMYQGIVKFFNDRDGSPSVLTPEAPTHLVAKNSGTGQITLTWDAPPAAGSGPSWEIEGDAPTGYKVYVGTHGRAFADGVLATGNSYTVTGLSPGTTYFFRVSSVNSGGESFPTSVVPARTPTTGTAVPYVIVDGFDRIDRAGAIRKTSSGALVNLRRLFLERMNSFDYATEHAHALASCNPSIAFDGAQNEAVRDGDISLLPYTLVNWYLGEESTVDETFDNTEIAVVQNYLDAGGDIIVSGAEIGWHLGRGSSTALQQGFYNNYLKATYLGDDGGTYNFTGVAGQIFAGVAGSFDDNTNCYYDSEFPDRLGANGGSSVVLNYSGGTADGAAVAYKNTFGVVNFGFPLETVISTSTRNSLMCNAVSFLDPLFLDIESLELTGRNDGLINHLDWTTLNEQETDYFQVQSSKDGFNFSSIQKIAAAGNFEGELSYSYEDQPPFSKTYYRIQLVNLDGSISYSNVVVLTQKGYFGVDVFPNPATDFVRFELKSNYTGGVHLMIHDITGKLILEKQWEVNPNHQEIIPTHQYSAGLYTYTLTFNNQTESGKLIIQ